jgi:hypothetical protein
MVFTSGLYERGEDGPLHRQGAVIDQFRHLEISEHAV